MEGGRLLDTARLFLPFPLQHKHRNLIRHPSAHSIIPLLHVRMRNIRNQHYYNDSYLRIVTIGVGIIITPFACLDQVVALNITLS